MTTLVQTDAPPVVRRFVVKLDARALVIAVDQVDWIESAANYVSLHVGVSSYMLRATMGSIQPKLDPHLFMRVHHGAIINLSRVQEYHMPSRGSM